MSIKGGTICAAFYILCVIKYFGYEAWNIKKTIYLK